MGALSVDMWTTSRAVPLQPIQSQMTDYQTYPPLPAVLLKQLPHQTLLTQWFYDALIKFVAHPLDTTQVHTKGKEM